MKNIALLLLAGLITASVSNTALAQQTTKELKKELKEKSIKQARKEAKAFKKQGYYVAPGALPLDKQLEAAWLKQLMVDDQGFPLYIVSTGTSVGQTQSAAKLQANETAKLELVGQISNNIGALIENQIANSQLDIEEATSVTKTVAASKNLIMLNIGRTLTLVVMYKKINKNIEANVRIAYNNALAVEEAKKTIRKQLEDETDILQEKLDKLMSF